MSSRNWMITYKAGDKQCESCHEELGEICCSRTKKHFYCIKPECSFSRKGTRQTPARIVNAGELICDAAGCKEPVPVGSYSHRQKRFFCPKCELIHKKESMLRTYKAGEKQCESCHEELGEIRCTYGKKHFYCTKPECSFSREGKRSTPARIVKAGELTCDGCKKKPVPAGTYSHRQKRFFCSDRCAGRRVHGTRKVQCACGCGKEMKRNPKLSTGLRFFSPQHHGAYLQAQSEKELSAPLAELHNRYLSEFAVLHYRRIEAPRNETRAFFKLLTKENIGDIDLVTPRHVSLFVAEKQKTTQSPRADFVKVMFDFFSEIDIFHHSNPVHPRIHYSAPPDNEPRPYTPESVDDIDRWGNRGGTRTKVAIAMGLEFGPRGIEVCNIHLPDVDLRGRRIWIRNPTKNHVAGWSPFSVQTETWLRVWLAERPQCDHDVLLTNAYGDPLRIHSLRYLLQGALCKESETRSYPKGHPEGFDTFNFHRLRHTNTTELRRNGVDTITNMKIHRWKDPKSMLKYTQILDEEQAEQYHSAIKKIAENKEKRKSTPSPISMAEYLASRKKGKG